MAVVFDNKEKEHAAAGDYEMNILRNVVRETWRKTVPERQKSNGTIETLEVHAGRMGKLFNNADYEAICIPQILEHSKYMSAVELRNYTMTVERLGRIYQQVYGNEIAGLLLIGIAKKARDTSSVRRYLELIISLLEKRNTRHLKLSDKEAAELRILSLRLYKSQRGILSFLRKGETAVLGSLIEDKKRRISRHSRKISKYSNVLGGAKHA